MERNRTISLLLAAIIIISIIMAGFSVWQRHKVEQANNNVEIALEYSQVWELSRLKDMELSEVLAEFKKVGVTTVLFKEQTADDLIEQGMASVRPGFELIQDDTFLQVNDRIQARHTYFITPYEEVFERLKLHLDNKVSGVETLTLEREGEEIFLVGMPLTLGIIQNRDIGLGFPGEGIDAVQENDLNVIPQVRSWPGLSDPDSLAAVFEDAAAIPNVSVLAFNDARIPGFPHLFFSLKEETEKMNVPLSVIEFFPQEGLHDLVYSLDKNAVRLHSISSDEMKEISPSRASDRYLLAVTERNVRVLLVRFFQRVDSPDWLQSNMAFIDGLTDSIESRGFSIGKAERFDSLPVSTVNITVMGLGVIAGGAILLEQIRQRKLALILGFAGAALWLGLLFFDFTLARKVIALSSVIIFPTLAVVSTIKPEKSSVSISILNIIRITLISLVGAVLTVGILADVGFMLKIDEFAGVRIGLLTPLLLIPLFLLIKYSGHSLLETTKSVLDGFVQYKWLFLLAALGGIGLLLFLRAGHEIAMVTDLELRVRALLGDYLSVRPRSKEFLFGHPLMLLSLYLGFRHRLLPLIVLGSIGQVSLVNTFEHVHTPLMVSVMRTFIGLFIGIVLGLVLIGLYKTLHRVGERIFNHV